MLQLDFSLMILKIFASQYTSDEDLVFLPSAWYCSDECGNLFLVSFEGSEFKTRAIIRTLQQCIVSVPSEHNF